MKLHRLLIACVVLGLSGCEVHVGSPHFFWEPKLQEARGTVEIQRRDGTKIQERVSYSFTPTRSGNTKETAVKMYCYNMISGDYDEQHLLQTRFPKATWTPSWGEDSITVKSDHRYYHVYHVTEPNGRSHLFWINATDYHDFF